MAPLQVCIIVTQMLLIVKLASCFTPIIPPRFDNFCDQVVGTWGIPIESQSRTRIVGEVEEVMRSCGGE